MTEQRATYPLPLILALYSGRNCHKAAAGMGGTHAHLLPILLAHTSATVVGAIDMFLQMCTRRHRALPSARRRHCVPTGKTPAAVQEGIRR